MSQLIPNQFLFRFRFRCHRAKFSKGDNLGRLQTKHRLPFLGGMDGRLEFADVRIGWSEAGLGIAYEIREKENPVYGEQDRPTACDGISLWLDARDARTIHRASRYCQRFLLNAHDGDTGNPVIMRKPIHRALEDAPSVDVSKVQFARYSFVDGEWVATSDPSEIRSYKMEAFFPAETIYGFDPEVNNRLGFFYRIRDQELGDQLLGAAPDMPYWEDPSLWSVLELC